MRCKKLGNDASTAQRHPQLWILKEKDWQVLIKFCRWFWRVAFLLDLSNSDLNNALRVRSTWLILFLVLGFSCLCFFGGSTCRQQRNVHSTQQHEQKTFRLLASTFLILSWYLMYFIVFPHFSRISANDFVFAKGFSCLCVMPAWQDDEKEFRPNSYLQARVWAGPWPVHSACIELKRIQYAWVLQLPPAVGINALDSFFFKSMII